MCCLGCTVLLIASCQRIVKHKVLEANTTVVKVMSLGLSKEEKLLLPTSVNVGFGAQFLIKKLSNLWLKSFILKPNVSKDMMTEGNYGAMA